MSATPSISRIEWRLSYALVLYPQGLQRLVHLLAEPPRLVGREVGRDELAGADDEAAVAPNLDRNLARPDGHARF
jgi:hypothetical protein